MHPQSVLVSETENLKLVDFRFRYGGVGRQPPSLRLEPPTWRWAEQNFKDSYENNIQA